MKANHLRIRLKRIMKTHVRCYESELVAYFVGTGFMKPVWANRSFWKSKQKTKVGFHEVVYNPIDMAPARIKYQFTPSVLKRYPSHDVRKNESLAMFATTMRIRTNNLSRNADR